MNRRSFLGAILAAGVAPAFAGSGVLMPVRKLWTPPLPILWGDGMHSDVEALNAFMDGRDVDNRSNAVLTAGIAIRVIEGGRFFIPKGQAIGTRCPNPPLVHLNNVEFTSRVVTMRFGRDEPVIYDRTYAAPSVPMLEMCA
jgi:hypothetical protein